MVLVVTIPLAPSVAELRRPRLLEKHKWGTRKDVPLLLPQEGADGVGTVLGSPLL